MQKTLIQNIEIKLVGIKIRTNNMNEMNPATAKIGATMSHYFEQSLAEKISGRKNPHTTYSVYTEYTDGVSGDYSYFLGEEVSDFTTLPEGFSQLIIPAQDYAKFTCGPGICPAVCIDAWQNIWQMTASDLGGERAFKADFEVYDERARDPLNMVLDIYIGIEPDGRK